MESSSDLDEIIRDKHKKTCENNECNIFLFKFISFFIPQNSFFLSSNMRLI